VFKQLIQYNWYW